VRQRAPPQKLVQQLAAQHRMARASVLVWEKRLDLLVHALAQLPDDVTLEVDENHSERRLVELLTRAYAITTRVRFVASTTGPSQGVIFRSILPASSFSPPTSPQAFRSMGELVESMVSPGDEPASARTHEDALLAGHRVALVTNYPAHYRLALFRSMAECLARAGTEFRVFFTGRRAASRPWLVGDSDSGFAKETVRSLELPLHSRRPHVPINLESVLVRFKPTLILCSGFSPFVAARVARVAARQGTIWGLWSGETLSTGSARSRIRHRQRRILARKASFGLAYGHAAGDYFEKLRPDLPVVYARNTAPVGAIAARPRESSDVVEMLVLGDLASPRKGIDLAIEALRVAPKLRCRLIVVGGGKLLPEVIRRAQGDSRVHFAGWLPPSRIRELYQRVDIVLFPTRLDVFGLVLVEAMGAGVAVAVSPAAGAVEDLAVNNYNCIIVPGNDPSAWAATVARLVSDKNLRAELGSAASRTIHNRWTIDHAAGAMLAGLRLGVLVGNDGQR
jgi:glycosyltransferase involved in cell wall biosynthesis